MRLYRTADGQWAGTQAAARAACRDAAIDGKAWEELDVPTDKPGLLDWLNQHCGPATVEAFRAERELDKLRERAAESAPAPIEQIKIMGGNLPHITSDDPTIWRRITRIPWEEQAQAEPASITLTDVEAFIQAADAFDLRSLFENIVLRGRELIAEVPHGR